MKSTNRTFNIVSLLTFVVVLFSACEEPKPKDDEPILVEAPKQIISIEQAKQMYDTYSERRIPIIKEYEGLNNDSTEFMPTRLAEYDYETLKQYLSYIENEAREAGVEINKLRFYLVNYPDAEKFDDGTPVKYPRQNSFFMVPTLKRDGGDYAFLTDDDGQGNRVAVLVKDRVRRSGRQQNTTGYRMRKPALGRGMLAINPYFQDGGDGEHSLVFNEAHVIPPPPQDTDFDD
jgi:hypothetical protein